MTTAEKHADALTKGIELAHRYYMSPECDRTNIAAWSTLIAYAEKALSDLKRDIRNAQVAA